MKTLNQILRLLVLTSLMATAQAQEVSIPDPGLNAAIRDALQKPAGPLTAQDLLSLTNLNANYSGVKSLEGLEAAPNLTTLNLSGNQLTNFSFLSGLTSLTTLFLGDNPLRTFVLPEPLAVTSLAGTVASLRSQGVSVYTYPLAVSLVSPQRTLTGAFGFRLTGPPAGYTILSSTDLAAWNELRTLTNALGAAVFTDPEGSNSSQKFYRAMARLP